MSVGVHRLSREELVLVVACGIAREYGCYFSPGFFFQLARAYAPSYPVTVSNEQIHRHLKSLEKNGYMKREGIFTIRQHEIPVYWPTNLGFEQFDYIMSKRREVIYVKNGPVG